jgi:carbonic anhydrase
MATTFSLLFFVVGPAWANDEPAHGASAAKKPAADITTTSASDAKEVGNQVREALGTSVAPNKKLNVIIAGKPSVAGVRTPASAPAPAPAAVTPQTSRQYIEARARALGLAREAAKPAERADAHGGEVHWNYEGEGGPQAWGKLKPEFNACAIGKRQSPINIEDGSTLLGPAEPITFNYVASNATVVNNGHTIQVDVQGDNSITLRGSNYRLLQFHFHTPSEEQINFKRSAMVAHLVHKNMEGQLAVVAVLLDTGTVSNFIDRVWTYMPLEANDRVRMPSESLNLTDLLPKDQRYYQFMGSLTTPPCTEGVLWMVLKQPVQISKAQYRLFSQIYPTNARPLQPLNGRSVREAQ